VQLAGDGFDNTGMAEADIVDVIAVQIQEAPALSVLEGGAPGATQHIETRRREGLMDEHVGILLDRVQEGSR
jgi:hypothetical protein